ncbi:hypothetical protein SAMN05444395_10869 [Flavobacterium fryxellicola]|nr:hypothetical protein [Flavobacterium fryxellicola]SHN73948.1 hypothetical protein SAMN05444395_10869 [Flavobacterium fryxellicola]
MKSIYTILILMFTLTASSQSNSVFGAYALTLATKENDVFEYKLTLSQDGTFYFHYYSNIKRGIPPEKHTYGKGTWSEQKNVISFLADKKSDFDAKHTLDFTNSKARFIIKSPRNKTDSVIKTRLTFVASDIFWLKNIAMIKLD